MLEEYRLKILPRRNEKFGMYPIMEFIMQRSRVNYALLSIAMLGYEVLQ